ncbi:MAG TPA: LysR family transcriptional regulator [Syntrophomonadaceae bacterium]|nr:LysR family transcriptional regulator [Syntrophomonadaceae bacterium]HNX28694.1 LysR family transcriptional regulator [Syntrophomonadaceae bacterium]HPR93508.1 LysR family transcriptional regulator [Syntrophomonadaceae bacterium]
MNIEQFVAFKLIAQNESFTKTARVLNMTQPAISAQIKQLENKYKVNLFKRSNAGVELTEAGQTFYDYSEKIIALYNEMEAEMRKKSCPDY